MPRKKEIKNARTMSVVLDGDIVDEIMTDIPPNEFSKLLRELLEEWKQQKNVKGLPYESGSLSNNITVGNDNVESILYKRLENIFNMLLRSSKEKGNYKILNDELERFYEMINPEFKLREKQQQKIEVRQ